MQMSQQLASADSSRIQALLLKHSALEERIDSELKRPSIDQLKLRSLKKQKLSLKEQIELSRKHA